MSQQFINQLTELQQHVYAMANLVQDVVEEACAVILQPDGALALRIVERDAEVDRAEVTVESEVIRLMALYQPTGSDIRLLCAILKANHDFERIADGAVNLAQRAQHLVGRIRADDWPILRAMAHHTRTILNHAVQAYLHRDVRQAQQVLREDAPIDRYYVEMVEAIIAATASHPERTATYLDLLSIAKNLERMADHATNIAEEVIFMITGQIVRHRLDQGSLAPAAE
ncbi:MAG: Phosphate-specific transport system accessory protein PhoU [Phycisphaerae bacterium]|nr:Phosphate-specific transport system accessory protein PhoU [Phycisphaerae bacterium]